MWISVDPWHFYLLWSIQYCFLLKEGENGLNGIKCVRRSRFVKVSCTCCFVSKGRNLSGPTQSICWSQSGTLSVARLCVVWVGSRQWTRIPNYSCIWPCHSISHSAWISMMIIEGSEMTLFHWDYMLNLDSGDWIRWKGFCTVWFNMNNFQSSITTSGNLMLI